MKKAVEPPSRIEPCLLEQMGTTLVDLIAELSAASARLGNRLHPRTASNLAELVRVMNCFYSNLIEGHNTTPREIERALAGKLAGEDDRRALQVEAAAHIRLQREVDRLHAEGALRSTALHDVAVGRHVPPGSDCVTAFMEHFERRYRLEPLGKSARIIAMAAAHHRLNYIHPFPDGNGRVSRLMSHAMGLKAGIGAHGLWSVSRGLARGLESPGFWSAKPRGFGPRNPVFIHNT